jgi:hypothetical protein
MPLFSTLALNLFPVLSVLAFGWSAFTLILLYWIENLIIGGFNALKILIASLVVGKAGGWVGAILIPFFVFHYGLFCFVHGIFIFAILGREGGESWVPVTGPTELAGAVIHNIQSDPGLFWNVLWLAAFHLYDFLRHWIGDGTWRTADPATQMFIPYPRIIVVHLTIMIGAIPVLLLGQPILAVLGLALVKTALDTGVIKTTGFARNRSR